MPTAVTTVNRPRDEVERRWLSLTHPHVSEAEAEVRFKEAPGDRGTEIHVSFDHSPPGGALGQAVQKLAGSDPVAKVKDDLRRFKQLVETGVITRSDATPSGESLESKSSQEPAQPAEEPELEEAQA